MLNNQRHERFCVEYLLDANATQAAIRAGYTEKSAKSQGHRLLKDEAVRRRIAELMEAMQGEKVADAREVLAYLTSVMRGETEAKGGQVRAAELLAKRYGLLTDKVAHLGGAIVKIVDDV